MVYSYVQALTPYATLVKDLIFNTGRELYVYIFWIGVHHFIPQIYAWYCSTTIYNTLFVAQTNVCKGLRWLLVTSGDSMVAMWYLLGLWFMKKIPKALENKGYT